MNRLFAWMLTAAAGSHWVSAEVRPWLDFEGSDAGAAWRAGRGASVQVVEAVAPAGGGGPAPRPEGHALRISAGAGGGVLLSQVPDGLAQACAIRLWLRRIGGQGATPAEIEVQFIEPDGRSRFWRKVTLSNSEWEAFELPLRFFRTTGARLPEWRQVRHFSLYARQAVTAELDAVTVVCAEGCGPDISLQELREIAFPGAPTGTVRLVRDAESAVMTDCAELDLAAIRTVMGQLTRELRRLLPFLPAPARPPVLLVFADRAQYRKFPGQLAQRMGAIAAEPTTDGYTVAGVATSFWDPQKGSLRPVYFHEFTHAWLAQAGGLACEGHWLHEAVASYLQLKLFPQPNFDALVRSALASNAARPLRELCSARPVNVRDYWQLVTVFRMLKERPPYAERLPRLFEAVRAHSSFDLGLYVEEAFGVDLDRLEADWRTFCEATWPAAPAPAPVDSQATSTAPPNG